MKRINDKILLDDKELKLLVKEGYDRVLYSDVR